MFFFLLPVSQVYRCVSDEGTRVVGFKIPESMTDAIASRLAGVKEIGVFLESRRYEFQILQRRSVPNSSQVSQASTQLPHALRRN